MPAWAWGVQRARCLGQSAAALAVRAQGPATVLAQRLARSLARRPGRGFSGLGRLIGLSPIFRGILGPWVAVPAVPIARRGAAAISPARPSFCWHQMGGLRKLHLS